MQLSQKIEQAHRAMH